MVMRLAALLLFATTIHAQWVSPVEQTYGPYLAPLTGGEPALVASSDRLLLAWSELDPVTRRAEIRTGILDFNGRLISDISTLPTWQAGAEATSPMVATNGDSFAVAWLESQRATRVAAVPLHADGSRTAEPLSFGGYFAGEIAPPLVWNRTAYVVDGHAFDAAGSIVISTAAIPPHLRYASGEAMVGMTWSTLPKRTSCFFHFCGELPEEFVVTWEVGRNLRMESGSETYPYYRPDARVVTAGDDDEMAIVWRSPKALTGIRVVDGMFGSKFNILEDADAPAPDGIAFDGERWLIVFTRGQDIWGAFAERTGRDATVFPIATSARKESKAQAIAIAPGRFLVSYASDLGADDHQFAGRVVLSEAPGKRRAARVSF
jgi:hypothetical protein